MAFSLFTVLYVQLSLSLPRVSAHLDLYLLFLSLSRNPAYALLPAYWPFSSSLNQAEGVLATIHLHSVQKDDLSLESPRKAFHGRSLSLGFMMGVTLGQSHEGLWQVGDREICQAEGA